jgi:NAD dependent epimerase/dehydratase family enzyme
MPVPGFAIRLLYGEMASIVTTGVRAKPRRLQELGYTFRAPELDGALEASL